MSMLINDEKQPKSKQQHDFDSCYARHRSYSTAGQYSVSVTDKVGNRCKEFYALSLFVLLVISLFVVHAIAFGVTFCRNAKRRQLSKPTSLLLCIIIYHILSLVRNCWHRWMSVVNSWVVAQLSSQTDMTVSNCRFLKTVACILGAFSRTNLSQRS